MSSDPAPRLPIRQLAPDPVSSPITPPLPRPKLSIAHLMLWTLGTGVALALARAEIATLEHHSVGLAQPTRYTATIFRVAAIVTAPFTGIAIAYALLVVWRLYRRQPLCLSQPGHWMLLIAGVLYLLNAPAQLLQAQLAAWASDSSQWALLTLSWLPHVPTYITAIILLWRAWRSERTSPRWGFVFAANLVLYAYFIVAAMFMLAAVAVGDLMWFVVLGVGLMAIPIYIAWLVSFPLAVLRDLWLKERRDPLHWAGVALIVVWVLATAVYLVASNAAF